MGKFGISENEVSSVRGQKCSPGVASKLIARDYSQFCPERRP